MTYIYTIVHFGCNSSYNDMWIPNVFIYKSYDEAFSKYTEIYDKELEASDDNLKEFINDWYSNLYEIREMSIYKKGSQLEVLGRNWWV